MHAHTRQARHRARRGRSAQRARGAAVHLQPLPHHHVPGRAHGGGASCMLQPALQRGKGAGQDVCSTLRLGGRGAPPPRAWWFSHAAGSFYTAAAPGLGHTITAPWAGAPPFYSTEPQPQQPTRLHFSDYHVMSCFEPNHRTSTGVQQ